MTPSRKARLAGVARFEPATSSRSPGHCTRIGRRERIDALCFDGRTRALGASQELCGDRARVPGMPAPALLGRRRESLYLTVTFTVLVRVTPPDEVMRTIG